MNRLWVRLSLAFLLVTWLAIAVVSVIVRNATETSFRHYVNQQNIARFGESLIDQLREYYVANGGWEGAESLLPGHGDGGSGGREQGRRGAQVLVADESGLVVAATDPSLTGSYLDETALVTAVPLLVDGIQVGWLAQETPGARVMNEAEARFLDETTNWLIAAAVGAGLLAVVFGAALAWELTRPLRALGDAVHALAAGHLGHQVEVSGTQEMIELAQAFNAMSHDLAEGEQLRQRMAADIAHELRTPVSVLRGHLEAMLDGVFPLDGEHLAVAYDQTFHLARLVDDLRLLTMAEAGRLPLERVQAMPEELVTRAVERFMPLAMDADIILSSDIEPALPVILVDIDRLQQVLGNLLTNALRHTQPGGQIRVTVTRRDRTVRFAISNTGEGLSAEQAAHVFERFWRAEEARERDRGGSGLGLAITQQLVNLHGGRIWVETSPGETTFIFEIPAEQAAS